jgi:hypothetical protein
MYAIDRQVWIKSLKQLGRVTERNYVGNPRKAHYIVHYMDEMGGSSDYLTGSNDLRPADWDCDGCGRWASGNPAATLINPSDDVVEGRYCFLCVKQGEREEEELRREYAAGY